MTRRASAAAGPVTDRHRGTPGPAGVTPARRTAGGWPSRRFGTADGGHHDGHNDDSDFSYFNCDSKASGLKGSLTARRRESTSLSTRSGRRGASGGGTIR